MGGTTMSRAVAHATKLLCQKEVKKNAVEQRRGRMRRALYLTDLESHSDQADVVSLIQTAAGKNIFTTVMGVDVDLSVWMVEQISSAKGARYLSVTDKDQFVERLTTEFDHDVTPVAFDIRFDLRAGDGTRFGAGFGTPELAGLASAGTSPKSATLVTEFPCSQLAPDGSAAGNIFLFKLSGMRAREDSFSLDFSYKPPHAARRVAVIAHVHDPRAHRRHFLSR